MFFGGVKFESHGVDEITEEMRVLVAAEACILIILLGYEKYRYLKKVEIRVKYIGSKDGIKAAGTGGRRVVQLVWSSTIEGSQHGTDNYNVILHEFAHVIDQAPMAELKVFQWVSTRLITRNGRRCWTKNMQNYRKPFNLERDTSMNTRYPVIRRRNFHLCHRSIFERSAVTFIQP